MCLILFSHHNHPNYKLVVAANRDEFYQRPTEQADFWEEAPMILAGKDAEAGGTWMGITKKGRISMLTNYRDLSNIKENAPSRGHLVSGFLKTEQQAADYLHHLETTGSQYNGYNIICGDIDHLYYYGNHQQGVHSIPNGIHGLSNAFLDTPWPKVERGKRLMRSFFEMDNPDANGMLDVLSDQVYPPDSELPDTGVGLLWERILSPMFITSDVYGPRSSSVILMGTNRDVIFLERTYNGSQYDTRSLSQQGQ